MSLSRHTSRTGRAATTACNAWLRDGDQKRRFAAERRIGAIAALRSNTANVSLYSSRFVSQNETWPVGHLSNEQQRRTITQLSEEDGNAALWEPTEELNGEKKSPWHSLLEPAARAVWRASTATPPPVLVDAQMSVIQDSERTSKQLRRTHRYVIQSHVALAERRERERRRAVNPVNRPDSLAHKSERNRDAQVTPVFYDPEKSLSNLKHRLLPNYAITRRVLMETQSLLGGPESFRPRRIVDFGIGCGSASAAALDVFDTLEWIHGVDPSRSMRDGADRILQAVSQEHSHPPRITLSESLSTTKKTSGADSTSGSGFDVALCSYTATELPHVASTLAAAAVLWEKLRPNGIFVMIEPGTPDGFSSVRAVRSMLLECCPPHHSDQKPGEEQCHVLAPCTHNGTCPMERHRRDYRKRRSEQNTGEEETDMLEDWDDDDESFDSDDDEDGFWSEDDSDWEKDEEMSQSNIDEKMDAKSTMAETDVFETAYCSFVHTFPGGTRRSSGEKFSYLVVQKRVVGDDSNTNKSELDQDKNTFHSTHVTDLLAETCRAGKAVRHKRKSRRQMVDEEKHTDLIRQAEELDSRYLNSKEDRLGLELLRGDTNRNSFGRIIRAPIKKRGHIYLDYCSAGLGNEDGRIVRHRITKGFSARIAPGIYTAARKARWGGYWPDVIDRISAKEDEKN